jgi:hypothetical protein
MLKLDGSFVVASAQFSKLDVQQKVNELSHRGKGNPEDASAPTVASDFKGKFALDRGILELHDLSFNVPGVVIALNGKYGLIDRWIFKAPRRSTPKFLKLPPASSQR